MASIEKRTANDGKISYRALIRLKGHRSESATFERLTDAREWSRNTESAIKERRYFKTSESKKHTIKELIERYTKRIKTQNPKRLEDIQSMLDWWEGEIGYCILSDLTRSLIVEKIEKLSLKTRKVGDKTLPLTPARVNRYISAFSHVCTLAVNEWEWLESNPMTRIKKHTEPRGRVRFLDDKERLKLLEACQVSKGQYLYLIVVMALSTGARQGEILNLRWQDVDLKRGLITLHETKNGERRTLPLTGHALELMKEHEKIRRIDTALVFASKSGKQPVNIRDSWLKALERAKIKDFRFHDLRHTAASYLVMNGASLAEIAEVLGHKTLSMVKRYAHLSEAHTHSVVASMNERIFG